VSLNLAHPVGPVEPVYPRMINDYALTIFGDV